MQQHIRSDLDRVALKNLPASSRWLEFERHEFTTPTRFFLENVIRLPAKPQVRVAKHDGRDGTRVRRDDRRPWAELNARSGSAAVPPEDDESGRSDDGDHSASEEQSRRQAHRGVGRARRLATRDDREHEQHSGKDKKEERPERETRPQPMELAYASAVSVVAARPFRTPLGRFCGCGPSQDILQMPRLRAERVIRCLTHQDVVRRRRRSFRTPYLMVHRESPALCWPASRSRRCRGAC